MAEQISLANERIEQQMKEQQEQHQKTQEKMLNSIRALTAYVSDLSQCLQSHHHCDLDNEEYFDHDDKYHHTSSLET